MNQNLKYKTAWDLKRAGWSISKIAKKLQVSDSSVKRYINRHEKSVAPAPTDITPDRLSSLVEKAWDGIEALIKSKRTPANVKANLYLRILNANGQMIEQKNINHGGQVNINQIREKNLKKGLESFGYAVAENPS